MGRCWNRRSLWRSMRRQARHRLAAGGDLPTDGSGLVAEGQLVLLEHPVESEGSTVALQRRCPVVWPRRALV